MEWEEQSCDLEIWITSLQFECHTRKKNNITFTHFFLIPFYLKKKDLNSEEACAQPQELSLPIRERRSAKVNILHTHIHCVYVMQWLDKAHLTVMFTGAVIHGLNTVDQTRVGILEQQY